MRIVLKVLGGLLLSMIIIPALYKLPIINLSPAAAISSSFYSYIRAGMYFLPAGTVAAILSIQISLWMFRIIIAVIKAFWEVLPLV